MDGFAKRVIRTRIRKAITAMAKLLYDFCIESDEFELLVQWDKEKNGSLTSHDVSKASHNGLVEMRKRSREESSSQISGKWHRMTTAAMKKIRK